MEPVTKPLTLRVSIAKEHDRSLIARLCRRAASRLDYVLKILPTIISHDTLFLAWHEGILVEMTNFGRCIDGSGWLSTARTDPAWRGRGVNVFLQQEIAAYAKRRGVRPLRLWVSSRNKPSLRACQRGGFRQVCEAAHISRNLGPHRHRRRINSSPPTETQLLRLLRSSYVTKTRGYIGFGRQFVKLTRPLLTKLRDSGELLANGGTTLLVSRPETTFGRPQSSFVILEGRLSKSLNLAIEIGEGMRTRILSSYIPYNSYEISVAKSLGFRRRPWGKHCLVFEKGI